MNLTPSLTTMCVQGCKTFFILETCYDIATKELPVTRLGIPGVPAGTSNVVIVVPGFLDSFVFVHHKHRLDSANHGNFGDCLGRRVRFRTAITPAYAHTYQTICLGMYFPGVSHHPFRFHRPEFRYPFFPMIVFFFFPKNLALIIVGLFFIRWRYPCCGW